MTPEQAVDVRPVKPTELRMIRRSRILALIFLGLAMSFPLLIGLGIEGFGEGVVLLFFGILITSLAVLAAMRGFSRRKWPTATGTITETDFAPGRGLFGWKDPEQSRLTVCYSYTVEGKTYEGNVRFSPNSDRCSELFGGYPEKNGTFQVYYNPLKPDESILVPGPGTPTLFFFVLGIAGTGLGCYLIWS
jgi:hypothetical protein